MLQGRPPRLSQDISTFWAPLSKNPLGHHSPPCCLRRCVGKGVLLIQIFLHSFYIIIIRDHPPVTLGVDVYVAANSSWAPQLAQLLTPRTYGRSEATARCSSKEEFSTLEPKWLRILRIRLLAHLHPLIIRCHRRLRTRLRSYRLAKQMLRQKLPPAGLLDGCCPNYCTTSEEQVVDPRRQTFGS